VNKGKGESILIPQDSEIPERYTRREFVAKLLRLKPVRKLPTK
jgi:hypothetical protein